MKRMKRNAVIVLLIEKMQEHGSWCGETHVQKATYFLQEMLRVTTSFEFTLYKHGPFSFELRDELTAMRADGLVELKLQSPPYGPTLIPGENASGLKRSFPKTLHRHESRMDFIAERFDARAVIELERLATALYVTRTGKAGGDKNARAARITKLKPHILIDEAKEGVEIVDEWQAEADQLLQMT